MIMVIVMTATTKLFAFAGLAPRVYMERQREG
jgi:hypothetical protein